MDEKYFENKMQEIMNHWLATSDLQDNISTLKQIFLDGRREQAGKDKKAVNAIQLGGEVAGQVFYKTGIKVFDEVLAALTAAGEEIR
jgi:hypothetical protein